MRHNILPKPVDLQRSLDHDNASQRPSRLMAGLALSLALHAALLFAWRQGKVAPQPAASARTSIAVRLRPPPAPPPPPQDAPPPRPSATKSVPAAGPKRRVAPDVIALPPSTPAAPAPPDAFTVEPPAPPAPSSAPRFDPDAARKLARQLANEPDPAKAGTALVRLPPKPLATETRAARAIGQAKRSDCKDGIPGGLLAPLILMMDKKDSGCQW
ncbi:MAG: hypothetical protein JWR40_4520 [Massilia sp.]|nr:hypothetical protein [Massilia sp.]